ncbi:MAG: M3 family oligoendopeptidase, partial [candidate division Zixibacteria bacterium]|nr:M3 family oligoendopeptidase [candidate division Zixibacteria bacterium]
MSPQMETTKMPPAPKWDLESIFPGGSQSKEFETFRQEIKNDIPKIKDQFSKLSDVLDDSNLDQWVDFILKLQELLDRVHHGNSFAHCLISQNVKDTKGHQIVGEMDVFESEYQKLIVSLEAFAKKQKDSQWQKLVEHEKLKSVSFFLNETREIAKQKMDPQLEAFATDLAVNGYHAWNRLYDKMYGDLTSDFTENGETKKLSLGQLANKMAVSDRSTRKQAFDCIEEAWGRRAELAAMSLNYQAGYRLTLYERRNWQTALVEPLIQSRISEETLNAMW